MKTVLGLMVLVILVGCGNKGPLYLPKDSQQQQEQAK